MSEPTQPDVASGIVARDRLTKRYFSKKHEYIDLCGRYDLPPRDLSLSSMEKSHIKHNDRLKLIRLVVQLVDLEKNLGPGVSKELLFAGDESQYINSAIFSQNLH
jgi:hypothetical protein